MAAGKDKAGAGAADAGQSRRRVRTQDVLSNIVVASALCSASIIEFTVPQVVKLSHKTDRPLPATPLFPHRLSLQGRMILPQTLITAAQFVGVREMRDVMDRALGPSPLNLSVAYGSVSVALIAAKYNMLISGVYSYHGRTHTFRKRDEPVSAACARVLRRNVMPGLLWSFLRDTGSIGGGVVLGPVVTARLSAATGDNGPLHRLMGGLLAGIGTGLATHVFHNAALTAGRMAESGAQPGNLECMRQLLAEHGYRSFYLNFRYRVGIIAWWTGVLNVAQPFATHSSTH